MSLALDIAFQAAPDHPYVREHEAWFRKRPDGTIQYAENPPKKYQDIYPFDFESEDWTGMWEELKSVFLYWIDQGVTIFRVDNPHTKAFPFWEWVITEIKRDHPEVLFLAEAFTRPKIMYRLAKLGFSQSYTYFPWRNAKGEITAYLTELTQPPVREFFRPNQWPNTPDILTEFLQIGGRAIFTIRLLLAATLGANYGIYGPAFELMENRAGTPRQRRISQLGEVRNPPLGSGADRQPAPPDRARQRHSQRQRGAAKRLVAQIPPCRQRPAHLLQQRIRRPLQPHPCPSSISTRITPRSGYVTLPLDELQIPTDRAYEAEDLLTGAALSVARSRATTLSSIRRSLSGHILKIHRRMKVETDFEYFL